MAAILREGLLDNLRSNNLAGTAPCGKAVENHEGLLDVQCLVESRLAANTIKSARMSDYTAMAAGHLRLEVVYARLFAAHFGGGCEERLGEEWAVEVCGRGGVDGRCSQWRGS